jgi:tetratricopeptide (TPR) repeat protein
MTFAPEERYATARALADDIERWTAGQTVSAWNEPFSRRLARWARKSQTAVAALTGAALVAIAGSAYVRTVQARATAEITSAHARETQRFHLAMNAIKAFQGEVNDHPLLAQKPFDDLRTRLRTSVAGYYDRLEMTVRSPLDRESLAAIGNAYDELGGLTRKIGDPAAALAIHRKALAVRRALAFAPGANAAGKLDLARSLLAIGNLERSTGDMTAAQASGAEARDLAKELGTPSGGDEHVPEVLTAALRLIAQVLSDTGDHDGALAAHRDALAAWQKLAAAKTGDLPIQTAFADSLLQVGRTLVAMGRPDEAIVYLDRQEEVCLKIAETHPTVPDHRHRLARCQIDTARSLLGLGRPAEARARCQRAVTTCESLMSVHPGTQDYRRTLAEALLRSGQSRLADADVSGAAADWRRGATLVDAASAPIGEDVFIAAGCHAAISSLAGRVGSPVSASERDAEIEMAMDLLRQAVGMGYREPAVYRTEEALDPLRGRDDFKLLVMDLAMPVDPLARGR